MGLGIDREVFAPDEYTRYSERLFECLQALGRTLSRPGFGEGPATLGAELELHLIDADLRPVPDNLGVIERSGDPRLTAEIDRFNLELNLTPLPLAGRPFEALRRELVETMEVADEAARASGARTAAIGILPTLRAEDVGPSSLTPRPRFRALSRGIRGSRGGRPFRICIHGQDTLDAEWSSVALEGANTSLQFHLRVSPSRFADVFNAAQLATAPALALCANSPFLLGHRLWDETRVAVFRQATDDRGELSSSWCPPARVSFGHGWVRHGALELFAEAVALHAPYLPVLGEQSPLEVVERGEVPRLDELRLHNGTVWSWNRPVYDPKEGGHLRIEFRALPSGPTPTDMVANGAFLIGLTLGLSARVRSLLPSLPFPLARENFLRAARDGMDAVLIWPGREGSAPAPRAVTELAPELLELASEGLEGAGVDPDEVSWLMQIVRDRAEAHLNGATWQRHRLAALEPRLGRDEALAHLLDRYLSLSDEGRPVHAWPD